MSRCRDIFCAIGMASSGRLHQGGPGSGHRRSALGAAFPLATGLHRTRDWVDSARVHRPRDRAQRGQSVSSPEIVYGVLSRDQDAPFAGEGLAGESVGATAGPWASGCAAASRRTSSSVRTSGGVNWRAGNCWRAITLEAQCPALAGGLQVRSDSRYPATANGLTNAGGTATEVHSLAETQKLGSTEFPRGQFYL